MCETTLTGGDTKYLDKKCQYHSSHNKLHMHCPRIDRGPQRGPVIRCAYWSPL